MFINIIHTSQFGECGEFIHILIYQDEENFQ